MKGFTELEFIISVFVFITSISFATAIIVHNIPLFHSTAISEQLKAKSWQHAEMLLLDEGSPVNWQTKQLPEIERIGLASGRYIVDRSKLDQLRIFCSDPAGYSTVKTKLGLTAANEVIVEASNLDDTPVVGSSKTLCRPAVLTETRPQFHTIRFGVLNFGDMPVIRIRVAII